MMNLQGRALEGKNENYVTETKLCFIEVNQACKRECKNERKQSDSQK